MEKKDLRAGMRIVTQSGHSYVFMKGVVNQIFDAFIPLEEDAPKGALFLEYYKDNLQREEKCRQDDNVVEVWDVDNLERITQIPDPAKDTLLWTSKALEITLEDIVKKFEVNVKRIKIVK